MTNLILICSGQTDWSAEGRWQGQENRSLDERGREQAHAIARELARLRPLVLYSSDLARALETSHIIAAESQTAIVEDSRLRDLDLGQWQGMTCAEIELNYPEQAHTWRVASARVQPPAGESIASLVDRVSAAINDILVRHPAGRVGVVSHELPIAAVLCCALKLGAENLFACIPVVGEWDELVLEGELPCALR